MWTFDDPYWLIIQYYDVIRLKQAKFLTYEANDMII